jgi:putative membrane protein
MAQSFASRRPDAPLSPAEKRLNRVILAVSVAVPAVVAVLFYTPALEWRADVSFLPKLNALINSTVSILLLTGYGLIRQRRMAAHRACMMAAFALSAVFLVSYVVYHSASEHTAFGGEGLVRTVYFALLISHILLAAIILPLVLFTFTRAMTGRVEQHRRLARWTFPLWLYVSVTGVIVYLMIAPYYAA